MWQKILHIQNCQVEKLQCMLLSQLKNSLIEVTNSLKKRKRSNGRQQLRNYFQQLPVTVRSELLNVFLCPYRSFQGPFHQFTRREEFFDICLMFLEVLLSPGMDYIYIYFPGERNFHQILLCLLQNTNKLKELFLPRWRYISRLNPTKYSTLLSQLSIKNGSWLTNLDLGSRCNDRLLHTIGENCHCLQNLDIEDSPVSDEGIQVLTQIWECREGRGLSNDEEKVDDSSIISQRVTRSITKPCMQTIRRHVCRYLGYKTKLCHSLRRINLRYTEVTEKGIHALLSTVNNLEDIGKPMVKLLDDLYKSYEENPETFQCPDWNLRSLFVRDPTPQHLRMLTKLSVTRKLIKNLTIELLDDDPIPDTITRDLHNYLKCYGSNLTQLNLTGFEWENLDLSSFLKHCPNLISLRLEAARLTWSDNKKPVPSPTLKFAQLTWEISCESAILFMESASALKEVYFSTLEEDEKFLKTLCEKCISKELKVLYLYNPNFQNNPGLVSEFWQSHKHIEFIGEISFDLTEVPLGSTMGLKFIDIVFVDP